MNSSKYFILAIVLAIAIGSRAQDLSTKVVVERSTEPTERAAMRLNGLSPVILLPEMNPVALSTANYGGVSTILRSLTHLNPADGSTLPLTDDSRGYLSLGYFPTFNFGVSAGYRAIATRSMTLDVWGQFDGEDYEAEKGFDRMKYNGLRLGANFAKSVDNNTRVDAALRYEYAGSSTMLRSKQSFHSSDFIGKWTSKIYEFDYNLGIGLGFDSYGNYVESILNHEIEGLSQFRFDINGGMSMSHGDEMCAGLNFKLDYGNSLGIFGLTPYYSMKFNNVNAHVGLNLDLSMFGDNGANLSPDINIAWNPMSQLALKTSFTGGVLLNTMNRVREISYYLPGNTLFSRSYVPIDAEFALCVGLFGGLSAEAFAGYAIAKDWLMPDGDVTGSMLSQVDVEGWHGGIRLNYRHKSFKTGISAEVASSDVDKAYYLWRDRAKYVISAFAEMSPIENLVAGLSYEFRNNRHTDTESLGCMSLLDLRARYDLRQNLSVFIETENLLGRRYWQLPTIASQTIHGLAGISWKF